MTEETTTEQLAEIEGQAELVQVREGRWRTRGGEIRNVTPTPEGDGRKDRYPWWDAQWLGTWTANGRYYSDREESPVDLVEYLGPIEPDKTQELPDKTQELPEYTPPEGWRVVQFGEQLLPGDVWVNEDGTEQRSNILQWDASAVSGGYCIRRIKPEPVPHPQPEPCAPCGSRDTCDTPATEYTPPEGWRVLAVGERLRDGDVTVGRDGSQYPTERVGGWVGSNQRYIRPIESQPQSESQPQPVQVREGRWRTRNGEIKNIRPCEPLKGAYYVWPWTDGFMTFQDNGRHLAAVSDNDLVEYLGPIEEQQKPQPEPHAAAIEELRSEVSHVQNLLGESRQRVTQLEDLVGSLRTINEAQEKAFEAAGKENTALKNQLAAVKTELANVAADRQQLRVELDAAQQVPADSPELRQLRADLEQMTLGRDTYRDGYERVLSDLKTIRETAKAEAVEAIVEWLVPIRTCGSQALATAVISNLPHIMRSLTGLEDEEIE